MIMSNLLSPSKLSAKELAKAVAIEFPIGDAQLLPVLVLLRSSKLTWVNSLNRNGSVLVPISKPISFDSLFWDVVTEIHKIGIQYQWENSYPLTQEGLAKAIDYVKEYGIEDLEILVSKTCSADFLIQEKTNIPVVQADWIPLDSVAIVVPKRRESLGILGVLPKGNCSMIVHNPSRGIAFAWN
jgi:hypothetical protein